MNRYRNGAQRPHSQQKAQKRRVRIAGRSVVRWLTCFPPAGLIMLWHPGCRWKKWNKVTATITCLAAWTIVVCGVLGVMQEDLHRGVGGTQLVSTRAAVEAYGPVIPEGVTYSYTDENIIEEAVLITPEPTIEPETAYVNDGGKYFHTENCRYIKSETPCYYVPTLLARGFQPCEECAAQALMAEYTGQN